MSDSEDDFMSDKFLVDVPKAAPKTYSDRRNLASLASHRKAQAGQQKTHKQMEEERRREGLATSLFDKAATSSAEGEGGPKALQFMQKMGWTPGQSLGKQRSESPPPAKRRRQEGGADEEEVEEDSAPARGGIGSSSRGRVEPLRISLWQGRKGLSARSPSPPPLPSNRDHHQLDPKRLERLGKATDDYRSRQRRDFEEKEVEKKESKARDQLVQLDEQKGVKFHPLHVMPADPLGTLPPPLLKLIYPAQAISPPSSPVASPAPPVIDPPPERERLVSNAERLREHMRREMLSELGAGEEQDVKFGVPSKEEDRPPRDDDTATREPAVDYGEIDWAEMVSGTKRVLRMDPREHLKYLISQLRHEHLYCFWCSFKYGSYDEMDGPGGCPGEEEDDH